MWNWILNWRVSRSGLRSEKSDFMESIEKKYKEMAAAGEVEKAKELVRGKFEDLMHKNLMGGQLGKEGYVFSISGRDKDDPDFEVLEDFDTADEARDRYYSLGRMIIEEGGELKLDYLPKDK